MKGKTLKQITNTSKSGLKEIPSLPSNEDFTIDLISKQSSKVYKINVNELNSATDSASTLFPKGYEFISESRDFLSTDEGKLLVLAAGVTLSMPSEFPFLSNQIVGVNALDSNCYYQDKSGSTVQIFGINNQPNEVVVLLSEPDFNSLLPISSSVIDGKTMLKYLYDKSQTVPTLQQVTDNGNITSNDIGVKQITIGNESTGGRLTIFNENGNYQSLYQPYALPDDNQLSYLPTTTGTLANSVNGIVASSDGNIDITDEVNTIVGNSRFFISKSASTTDADFNATPGTAYMLLEVADNDKVITLTSPVDGDIYRFNNVTQPTNNWITNVTIFLSDGTTSNVVPASKITVIQYDAAASVFHQISSQ